MASFNKVILLGNLTRDPQLSYLPNQTPVVEFGLATNRKFKGSDGTMRDDTCFVDCKAFGRTAETISKYCTKGKPLLIEGRLTFESWEAQDGSKRSKLRVTVESFTFVGGGGGGGDGGGGNEGGGGGYSQNNSRPAYNNDNNANNNNNNDNAGSAPPPGPGPSDDDVPF